MSTGWGMAEDYYQVLGVTKDATSQEIKRAFREIARKCHPDLAGTDPAAEEQFKSARRAYETLMDPVARARYDRRGQRSTPAGSFFDAFYKATERAQNAKAASGGRMNVTGTGPSTATGRKNPGNAVSLDDLVNDFGDYGFGVKARAGRPPEPSAARHAPQPGEDVHIDLDVPADIAREGGSLTAVYYRMQRADSWRPGSPDPGLIRVQDVADIRVVPGTVHGEILRERGLGNAGSYGGTYGDLVVRVRIVAPRVAPETRRPAPYGPASYGAGTNGAGANGGGYGAGSGAAENGAGHGSATRDAGKTTQEPTASAQGPLPGATYVDLTIVEAMLGGRVSLETPQGRVRLTIPPGTSSGVQLRLKGRGLPDATGQPQDFFVWTRIVVPKQLDPESRRLIEEYARLNPSSSEE